MERPSLLFVYGTLRRGLPNKYSRLLARQSSFLGRACLRGRLHRIGRYSGAILSSKPNEWIRGEVFRLADPAALLPILDDYEGPQFERTLALVRLDSGRRPRAWVYLYRKRPAI